MKTKVIKSTSKGQVTLPVKWRDQFDTDNFLMEMRENRLIITPLFLDFDIEDESNCAKIWNSKRDNDGKGLPVDDLIKMLEDIKGE